ncbi:exosortase-dependent surface protein XDP1 [Paraglaciecola arctica]|uniref:exosortase-dependent surface protein XDP1 n=1 Tax=Paraglaciecola arctica TaxID=1128911 RepID=UPI001C079841|nr:exosortase-dependent surface protein XDP1 [Paraglaciecola arctica]MBU3003584.1 hypothetical protein [Paraglaciecola arctica]
MLSKNKFIISVLLAFIASTSNSFAGSGHSGYNGKYKSGCSHSTPDSGTCDSWEGALNYDMYIENGSGNNVDAGFDINGSSVIVDGVGIEVSAWSDTGNYDGYYTDGNWYGLYYDDPNNYGIEDDTIHEAELAGPWSSNGETGFGTENADGVYQNSGDSHSIDNFSNDSGATDYDMVLFSFSDAVSLVGATFSWLTNSSSTQQVSVVGLNDISGLTGGSSTWSDIASSDSVVTSGSFQIEHCDDVYVSDFTTTDAAQYWLVGAYNTAFGYVDGFSRNNDGFKLASIGFTKEPDSVEKPPVEANAPSSFALLMLTGGFMAWRKRKTK